MSDMGHEIPDDAEFWTDDQGYQRAEIEGETYVLGEDNNYHHISAFAAETDEPAVVSDEAVPAWAQPLLERHAREAEDATRADERARIEAEEAEAESPFVEWLQARPHLLADFENFERFVDATPDGDLERAEQLWHASEAKLDEARVKESIQQPRDLDDAMSQWFDEKRQAKRAEAVAEPAAESTFKQDPPRRADPLDAAMHDFMEENHARVDLDKQARELVKQQERRGRG
jgi:hypothetical protein